VAGQKRGRTLFVSNHIIVLNKLYGVSMDCMNKKNPPQVVGMTYVPWQHWGEVYEPCRALKYGTLFPILNKPFVGCRCDRSR
jgi:hypothetical protein